MLCISVNSGKMKIGDKVVYLACAFAHYSTKANATPCLALQGHECYSIAPAYIRVSYNALAWKNY